MAVAHLDSVELEEQRAELNTVLESKEFTRAPTLARLLSYLCERLFAGEANQIKEYSVGVEVFHRGASFDQDSDSIVRVEANRLRKRLADFYAGDGASHRLRITIPVGQYVPRFEPRGLERSEQSSGSEASVQPEIDRAGDLDRERSIGHPGKRFGWIVAVVLLLMLGLGIGMLAPRLKKTPTPSLMTNEPVATSTELQIGPPAGDEVHILAGANRSFVDHAGKLWNADVHFTGGTAVKSPVQHIRRTQDPDFYRNSRQGQFRYDIPLGKGIYELRLHFAEMIYGPESSGTGGEGSRIMTVRANGKTLLDNFDIVTDTGASLTADVKVFYDVSPAEDGFLHLEFAGGDGKQATLSAIEVLPGIAGRMRPVRILARQTPYYSNDSKWWSPDNYFDGGQIATHMTPVSGTDDPELYETERWGNFSYAIPVPPGKYSATLHFAARHGDWGQPPAEADKDRPSIAHIFNVFCNGKVLLQNFDLSQEARQTDVVIRRVKGLVPNAQGKLLLSFVPVRGYATVTGIEVVPQ